MDSTPSRGQSRGPLRIAAIYLVAAALWALFSDRWVANMLQDPELTAMARTLKDWLFAIGTAGLIYLLLKREIATYRTTTEHLSKSRQELLDILDAMPVGVVLTDGENIEYVNVSFSELFGYSLDEISTEKQLFLLALPDPAYRQETVAAWRAGMERAQHEGRAIGLIEVKVTCKNGQIRHVIVNTQFIDNRIVVILTDITERERLQSALIKMQKLESIGVLAGGIAHDFNNILTGVMGNLSYARLLLGSSNAADHALVSAEKASRRAAELTRQLLTFAQGGEPIKKVLNPGQLVNDAVTMTLRGTSVRGEVRIDGAVRPIEADEGQVTQVLHNVILNAVQAMPEGGVLRVAVDNQRLAAANAWMLAEGEYVRITIVDEGHGIAEETLTHIFDPYFSTKEFGSGLGLATSYSIVNRHGGDISVESRLGKGTTCTMHLPATEKSLPDQPSPPVNSSPVEAVDQCQAILVMDDAASIRDLAATMLTHLGYRVKTCAHGEEAIQLYADALAAGSPYAVVIVDLTVPGGMGGLEAARRIFALDSTACLLVSSGYSHDPVMAEFREHGFAGMLAKPYTVAEMQQALHAVLAARQLP